MISAPTKSVIGVEGAGIIVVTGVPGFREVVAVKFDNSMVAQPGSVRVAAVGRVTFRSNFSQPAWLLISTEKTLTGLVTVSMPALGVRAPVAGSSVIVPLAETAKMPKFIFDCVIEVTSDVRHVALLTIPPGGPLPGGGPGIPPAAA